MTRQRRLLYLSLVAATSMGVVACGGKTQPATTTETTGTTTNTGPATTTSAHKPRGPMSFIAKSANLLVVIRPQTLRGTSLGELATSVIKLQGIQTLLTMCAIDPLKDVELVVVAGDFASDDNATFFVKGSFGKKQLDDCIGKLKAKMTGLEVTRDGDIIHAEVNGEDVYARWISGGVLASAIKANLDLTALSGPSAELSANMARLNPRALFAFTATAAALNSAESPTRKLPPEAQPSRAYGNLVVGTGIRVELGAGMSSAAGATAAKNKLGEMLAGVNKMPIVGGIVKQMKISVATSGSEVIISVHVDQAQVDALIMMAKMAM